MRRIVCLLYSLTRAISVRGTGRRCTGYRHRRWASVLAAAALSSLDPTGATGAYDGLDAADVGPLKAQRAAFIEAEQALARGQRTRFERIARTLESYPLYPYLRYADLRRRLARAAEPEVAGFITRYSDTPLVARIRWRWLARLAKRGQWQRFLRHYAETNDAAMRCRRVQALLAIGKRAQALDAVPALWLSKVSQPKACDPVFKAWLDEGHLTRDLVWKRIKLAMSAGQTSLARYLARFVEPRDRELVGVWRRLHSRPSLVARYANLQGDREIVEGILIHGMRRLAVQNLDRAVEVWPEVRAGFDFSDQGRYNVLNYVGCRLARRQRPEALDWFHRVPPQYLDSHAREWQVVAAIRHRRWALALRHLDEGAGLALGAKGAGVVVLDPADSRWRYWRARALAETGDSAAAAAAYRDISGERSYYGFLAADRTGRDYRFGHRRLRIPTDRLRRVSALPGAIRARELLVLGRRVDARREWQLLIRDLTDTELVVAAELAHRWSWHGRAILTVARTSHRDDLELRFPVAHRGEVEPRARRLDLDPAWLFAVIRQESAFITDARSPAGALGLMQIMPATGRHIAKALKTKFLGRAGLLQAETSVRFGSTYLRMLLDRLDDHPVLATAAYNAGPHNVDRWRTEDQAVPADVWIENVPFHETREFLRRVLAYTAIYAYRLGRDSFVLSDWLTPISGSGNSR